MLSGALFSSIIGFSVGGTGIGLGGLVACGLGKRCEKVLGLMLAVSAGMIFSLLFFELLPESFEVGGEITTILGIVAGSILIHLVGRVFHRVVIITGDFQRSLFIRSSILFALGVAVHNFPVGIALGAGLFNEPRVGLDLATTMLFHNFPEGLALSLPMVFSDVNRIFVPVTASIVAIPAGIGSFLGYNLGSISPQTITFLFGVAIGTIFYVTWHEILGRARKQVVLISLLTCLGIGMFAGKLLSYLVR